MLILARRLELHRIHGYFQLRGGKQAQVVRVHNCILPKLQNCNVIQFAVKHSRFTNAITASNLLIMYYVNAFTDTKRDQQALFDII